ncbi:MAG: hypothetical protein ACRDQ4_24695 [Pseudonocardiaceae bacterium]
MRVTAEDTPEAVRLKGSLKVLDVLAAAVADESETFRGCDLMSQPRNVSLS